MNINKDIQLYINQKKIIKPYLLTKYYHFLLISTNINKNDHIKLINKINQFSIKLNLYNYLHENEKIFINITFKSRVYTINFNKLLSIKYNFQIYVYKNIMYRNNINKYLNTTIINKKIIPKTSINKPLLNNNKNNHNEKQTIKLTNIIHKLNNIIEELKKIINESNNTIQKIKQSKISDINKNNILKLNQNKLKKENNNVDIKKINNKKIINRWKMAGKKWALARDKRFLEDKKIYQEKLAKDNQLIYGTKNLISKMFGKTQNLTTKIAKKSISKSKIINLYTEFPHIYNKKNARTLAYNSVKPEQAKYLLHHIKYIIKYKTNLKLYKFQFFHHIEKSKIYIYIDTDNPNFSKELLKQLVYSNYKPEIYYGLRMYGYIYANTKNLLDKFRDFTFNPLKNNN